MPFDRVGRQWHARRQPVAQRAPVRGRHRCRIDAERFDGVDLWQEQLHLPFTLGAQKQARTRLDARDALHRIEWRARLQHHELPACRAIVVGFPAHAAEHCRRCEDRVAPLAIQPQFTNRMTEAQVEVDPVLDEHQ